MTDPTGTGIDRPNLILFLLPGRIISIAEMFGYKCDCKTGPVEGLQRRSCDVTLLIFSPCTPLPPRLRVSTSRWQRLSSTGTRSGIPLVRSALPIYPEISYRPRTYRHLQASSPTLQGSTKGINRGLPPCHRITVKVLPLHASASGKSPLRTSRSCKSPSYSSTGLRWWPMQHGAGLTYTTPARVSSI